MRTRSIDVGDVVVSYVHSDMSPTDGGRPPFDAGEMFVFVHDVGENARMWHRQIDILGVAHSALAVDLPGHGASGGAGGLASVAEYATFLSAFVEKLALRPFVLIGKGLGASVALHFGAANIRRTRGLVLLSGAAKPEIAAETLAAWQDPIQAAVAQPTVDELFSPTTSLEVRSAVWSELEGSDPRIRGLDLVAWTSDDFRSRLSEIRQPVLVVAGADDRIVAPETSQDLCPQLANARLEIIENAGHVAELEQADVLAARIDEFVRSLDREH